MQDSWHRNLYNDMVSAGLSKQDILKLEDYGRFCKSLPELRAKRMAEEAAAERSRKIRENIDVTYYQSMEQPMMFIDSSLVSMLTTTFF